VLHSVEYLARKYRQTDCVNLKYEQTFDT